MISVFVILFTVSFLSLYIANQIVYDSSANLVSSYSVQQISAVNSLFDNSYKSFTDKLVDESVNKFVDSKKESDKSKDKLENIIKKIKTEYSAKGFIVFGEDSKSLYCDIKINDEEKFLERSFQYISVYDKKLTDFGYISFLDEKEGFIVQIFPIERDDKLLLYGGVIFEKDFIHENNINLYSPYSANPEVYFISPENKSLSASSDNFEKYLVEASSAINLSKDRKVFCYRTAIPSGLNVVYIFPSSKYTSFMKNILGYIILLNILLLLSSFLIILAFSNSILIPLKNLSEKMKSERKNL
jgi:hypothetical protein